MGQEKQHWFAVLVRESGLGRKSGAHVWAGGRVRWEHAVRFPGPARTPLGPATPAAPLATTGSVPAFPLGLLHSCRLPSCSGPRCAAAGPRRAHSRSPPALPPSLPPGPPCHAQVVQLLDARLAGGAGVLLSVGEKNNKSQHTQRSSRAAGAARSAPGVEAYCPRTKR